jgi:hypothetical protein
LIGAPAQTLHAPETYTENKPEKNIIAEHIRVTTRDNSKKTQKKERKAILTPLV